MNASLRPRTRAEGRKRALLEVYATLPDRIAASSAAVTGFVNDLAGDQASRLLRRLAASHPELSLEGERRGARYVWKGPERQPKRRGK